jgi:DNA ligase-associated metallophosphoesterase
MYLVNRRVQISVSFEERSRSCAQLELNGTVAICDPSGGLYLPDLSLLVVSDLHLEKGAAFARRGQMLPPYDTIETLKILRSLIDHYQPQTVVSLGDNFHDRRGSEFLPNDIRTMLNDIIGDRQWIWINGNHDPDGTHGLKGISSDEYQVDGLVFRHEPSTVQVAGEIAGHLHPCAVVRRQGSSIRSACFASDGKRLLMPAFGTMSGGLDLRHRAFRGLFMQSQLVTYILGKERVYPVRFDRLLG